MAESRNSEFEKEAASSSLELRLTPLERAAGATCNAYSSRLFGKKVFVKEIKPEFAGDARMLAAFRKEAELGFRLDHQGLPKYVYAEGVLPSERYIVQEFIDGQTLPEFIKEHPSYFQKRKNVESFLRELADIIDYLHRNGIVHLDLKPDNLIITRVGHALKLVDLGFCASDFYDDTRGFTFSELAPEGRIRPEERGPESDYHGVGRILNYIRTTTPGFPQNRFRKLETGLLRHDPAKRIASKDEIEKILERNGRKRKAWVVAVSTLIISAVAIFFILVNIPWDRKVESGKTEAVRESPDITESETNTGNTVDNSKERSAGTPSKEHADKEYYKEQSNPLVAEENINAQKQEYDISGQGGFSQESYDKLKAEMKENIKKNFADFEKILNACLRDGKFTETDYKAVTEAYKAALHETFITTYYKAEYKDLSPSVIDDTMAEVMQETEKANWGPVFKKYIREYQASLSGSSK